MSENEPTPGPWYAKAPEPVIADDDDSWTIVAADGTEIAGTLGATDGVPDKETEIANAELIAQAPETKAQRDELLAAALGAEQSLADFIGVYGDSGAGEVLAELRAAIRRAQGGGDE